jgi:rusticyanin
MQFELNLTRPIRVVLASVVMGPILLAPALGHERHHFVLSTSHEKSISESAVAGTQKTSTKGFASADRKTLTFRGRSIRLVVTTGPEKDMLSYRIAGRRNPTLLVPAGATLNILFINTDEDMTHDLRFTTQKPPFPIRVDAAGMVGSHALPHGGAQVHRGEEMVIMVPTVKGSYRYLCTTVGHAKGGMYGTLIVR